MYYPVFSNLICLDLRRVFSSTLTVFYSIIRKNFSFVFYHSLRIMILGWLCTNFIWQLTSARDRQNYQLLFTLLYFYFGYEMEMWGCWLRRFNFKLNYTISWFLPGNMSSVLKGKIWIYTLVFVVVHISWTSNCNHSNHKKLLKIHHPCVGVAQVGNSELKLRNWISKGVGSI